MQTQRCSMKRLRQIPLTAFTLSLLGLPALGFSDPLLPTQVIPASTNTVGEAADNLIGMTIKVNTIRTGPNAINQYILRAYAQTGCSGDNTQITSAITTADYTFQGGYTYLYSASSVYDSVQNLSAIHSISFEPLQPISVLSKNTTPTPNDVTDAFTSIPCFQESCNDQTQACTSSTVADVTLAPPPPL